jgi:hypothetical protein
MYRTNKKLLAPYLYQPLDLSQVSDKLSEIAMIRTGAKVYGRRRGCVTELFLSGYAPGDRDVPMDARKA